MYTGFDPMMDNTKRAAALLWLVTTLMLTAMSFSTAIESVEQGVLKSGMFDPHDERSSSLAELVDFASSGRAHAADTTSGSTAFGNPHWVEGHSTEPLLQLQGTVL